MNAEHWCAILNPCAGAKRLLKDLPVIEKHLSEMPLSIEKIVTSYKGHARDLAKQKVEQGVRNLLIFGGDGTMNEVVNGIFSSNVVEKSEINVALVPYGTGNDWARYWGIKRRKNNLKQLLTVIVEGKKHRIDVGCATVLDASRRKYYFLNAIGMGFDAVVTKYASTIKNHFFSGAWVYSCAVFMAVVGHRSRKMQILCDGETVLEERIYTMSIGNGCYTGGGLKQTPDAAPTDGIFHSKVVKKLSFLHILRAVKHLFSATLLQHPCVYAFEQKEFVCHAETPFEMEADGVQLPACSDVQVSVIPQSLTFVAPER